MRAQIQNRLDEEEEGQEDVQKQVLSYQRFVPGKLIEQKIEIHIRMWCEESDRMAKHEV